MPRSKSASPSSDISISDLLPIDILEQIRERKRSNKLVTVFPESGSLSRHNYPKAMEFLEAGREHDERLYLAANKTGKTVTGAFETTLHATGLYPHWWKGHVFPRPTTGWICNQTTTDVRDINQQVLLGDPGQFGTGLIPKDLIIDTKAKSSVPNGVEMIYVRHVTGGQSVIYTKSYDQGRTKFQGRNIDYIWADEEIPSDVYGECIMRIMVTKGIIYCTYTPVLGLTPITVSYLRESVNKDKLPLKFESTNDDKSTSKFNLYTPTGPRK